MKSGSLTKPGIPLAPSELVLDKRGAAYHIGVRPEEIGDVVLIAGDPGRIKKISNRFDRLNFVHENREFVTHTGELGGMRITAMATGIGTDNIDIVLNELDALVNIDLNTRQVKEQLKSLKIIRLGTCGALRPDVAVDSFVVSRFALGLDNVCQYYDHEYSETEQGLLKKIQETLVCPPSFPSFYLSEGDSDLVNLLGKDCRKGITATASGFYGPQGRQLRMRPAAPDLNDQFAEFDHNGLQFLNYEMETSALYGLSAMLGHQACTICTVIANRCSKTYSGNYQKAVDGMIEHVLERLKEPGHGRK